MAMAVWLLFAPLSSHARSGPAVKHKPDVLHDLAILAEGRPGKCTEDTTSEPQPRGWRQSTAQCVWQGRLQMRRWVADESDDARSCLSRQAMWWAWASTRTVVAAGAVVVWNGEWSTQGLLDESGPQKRAGMIERGADGNWIATEWRWIPAERKTTAQWQEARWKLLADAVNEMHQAVGQDAVPQDLGLLMATWQKNLKGRPAEISGGNWFWERDGRCLRMETAGLSQAQLHLPYAKDEGRLEQRAAMQLQLARTYPKATWITPFRLLTLPDPVRRGGAKYEALWMENAMVKGQIWVPAKADGGIFRARIAVALPVKKNREVHAATISSIAHSIESELVGLAVTWALDHEK